MKNENILITSMLNSRVSQFFKNIFGQKDNHEEQAYIPVSSEEQAIETAQPPGDNYRIVYLIFLLQGLTMLLGWNVLITSSVFFYESFRGSVYADDFQNYFSVVFMSSNLFFLGLALFTQKGANISCRIFTAIALVTLKFLLIAISTQYVEFFGPTGYFYFIIMLTGVAGATCSYLQNGIFALVSQFPPIYTLSVMSGQGLSGLFASLFQIFSALTASPSAPFDTPAKNYLSHSAFLYFFSAFVISLLTLISYFILIRSPLYIYYTSTREQVRMTQNIETTYDKGSIKATFDKIRILTFVVGFVFAVTLSVYPSITAHIKSTVEDEDKSKFHQDYLFIPLHFLIFNLGDWLGKCLPSLQFFIISDSIILRHMSIARFIFLPIFLICNVDVGSNGTRILPLVISSDLIYFLVLLLFAVSNGYIGTLSMMVAPQVEGVSKDLAGTIMYFCLVLGLTIGSIISFPIRAISCGCNPIRN